MYHPARSSSAFQRFTTSIVWTLWTAHDLSFNGLPCSDEPHVSAHTVPSLLLYNTLCSTDAKPQLIVRRSRNESNTLQFSTSFPCLLPPIENPITLELSAQRPQTQTCSANAPTRYFFKVVPQLCTQYHVIMTRYIHDHNPILPIRIIHLHFKSSHDSTNFKLCSALLCYISFSKLQHRTLPSIALSFIAVP